MRCGAKLASLPPPLSEAQLRPGTAPPRSPQRPGPIAAASASSSSASSPRPGHRRRCGGDAPGAGAGREEEEEEEEEEGEGSDPARPAARRRPPDGAAPRVLGRTRTFGFNPGAVGRCLAVRCQAAEPSAEWLKHHLFPLDLLETSPRRAMTGEKPLFATLSPTPVPLCMGKPNLTGASLPKLTLKLGSLHQKGGFSLRAPAFLLPNGFKFTRGAAVPLPSPTRGLCPGFCRHVWMEASGTLANSEISLI
ncbi:uncharacterized protein LOC129197476 [Grus americana]|uniref:uncharacterized protein LOC129197476 n=1 Tax=Grus americana TaxID=9117 RepID=UPI002407BDB1|nr:uncharacterized protein LOC129197476 [Grus americana]